jgi:outer membrane protein OmpA-like peptidoglycan-associated protein
MKSLLTVYFLLFLTPIFSQSLLVNGGFEDENICTEYKINCAPEAWISNTDGFNNYFKDANRAYAGEHCMAIEAGHSAKPFQRTFIRSRLLCGLRKDHQYRLEFYIKSPHDVLDSIGAIFTSYDFLFDQRHLQSITPSLFIKAASGSFVKDSSWQKVSVIYTAKGDEAFMSIGNFSSLDITGETNLLLENHFFVFLDNISLVAVDPHEELCHGWGINKEEIYSQDERHNYLQRIIKAYRKNPPPVVVTPTRFVQVDTLILPDVLFATGKSNLQKNSYGMLDSFCNRLIGKRLDSLIVEGHTDNTGSAQINEKLSMNRALAVENAIRERLPGRRLYFITRGWADRKPVADNNTPAGREQNRRVELFVYIRE